MGRVAPETALGVLQDVIREYKEEVRKKHFVPEPVLNRIAAIVLYQFGLTQSTIAKILGITQGAVSNYLRGKRGNHIERLKEIINIDKLEDDLYLLLKKHEKFIQALL